MPSAPAARKAERCAARNAALRARDRNPIPVTLAEWHAEWDAELASAVAVNPVEPRLEVAWPTLRTFEEWASSRRWFISAMGPNQGINGNNVRLMRTPGGGDVSYADGEGEPE